MITLEEFVKLIDGNEYLEEIGEEEMALGTDNGIVVVYGYSDDGVILDCAIRDEWSAYGGGLFKIDDKGNAERCYSIERVVNEGGKYIEAIWCPKEHEDVSWSYDTNIPHVTFRIMEEDVIYCIGFAFYKSDLV